MPLDALLACMDGFPATLPKAGQLKYASTHILGFGMEGSPPEALTTKNWVYFPEPEFLFHRMTVLSNYSPYNVPRPGRQWSLLCEVNEPPERPRDSETVENEVICALRRANFIQEDTRMVARWHRRLEHAYPIPFLGRDELLEGIDPVLRELGIWSRGRFGAWKYEVANQDHCFMQGVEAVDHILAGAEETTYSRS
jgi:protoporphyrinogen oxidase